MNYKLKNNTKTIIIISSLISIGLVLFIAFSANFYITRMSANNTELYSAYRISELMKNFKSNINLLENKQRGYIVTGDAKFLEEYKLKESETKTYLKSMEKYFSRKPEEEAFYKLKKLTYEKLTEAKAWNGSINNIGIPGGNQNLQDISFNNKTDIANTINEINESLSQTTKVLLDKSEEYVTTSKRWSYIEISLAILTALASVIILMTDINTRNKLEDELRIAKKLADENAILKEQFMANMSHEIRTPMNSILGFSNLLEKTNLDKTQSDYLMAVKTSGTNLLNIINDILDFSKIEAGKLNIEKISFNIIDLLNSLEVIFIQKANDKNISFNMHIDEHTPQYVFGDPTRLNQILINLISNAIKFTQIGSVNLYCEIKSIENEVVQFLFKVKDTGIGISSDKTSSIFERFNQGNTETTRKYGGNGLGLAIVKQLVEIQHGEINLKSIEGIGSEFMVTISYPISYENNQMPIEKASNQLLIKTTKTQCILLAEDNKLNQKLSFAYLTNFGLQVEIAENGIEALDKFKNKTYDLILMDIQMPLMDGYQATKKIREEFKSTIPIIAMTATIIANERDKCLSYGMNDYISKPFKEIELFNVLNKYLKNDLSIKHPESTINKASLYSLSRGNTVFIIEIVSSFLEQNPKDIKELETAISQIDYASIKMISHKMKTSVGFIGLEQLLPDLNYIEDLAIKKENIKELQLAFDKVKIICDLAMYELKEIIEELTSKS